MAAPVTEPTVLEAESGPRFLSQLRTALEARPAADRFVIGGRDIPAAAGGTNDPIIVVGRPVTDTCKEVVEGLVRRTVSRQDLVMLTGPWLVTREALVAALDRIGQNTANDPLELFRGSGLPIRLSAEE